MRNVFLVLINTQAQPGLVLDEFFKSTQGRFKTETG